MRPARAVLAFGILMAGLGEALAAAASRGSSSVSMFQTDWPTLLLFLCLFLMLCIGYTVRSLNKANRQLHDANNRLECQARDLSGNNDQLRKEVAERRRTESALRASENFYYSLVESVPHNIFRKDAGGKYTFVNRAFCATLAKPAAEIVGKTDQDLLPADLASRFRREEEQLLLARKQNVTEQSYPTAAGGKICMQMIRTPLFDASGQPVGRPQPAGCLFGRLPLRTPAPLLGQPRVADRRGLAAGRSRRHHQRWIARRARGGQRRGR